MIFFKKNKKLFKEHNGLDAFKEHLNSLNINVKVTTMQISPPKKVKENYT